MTAQPCGVRPHNVPVIAAAYLRERLAGRAELFASGVYVGDRKPPTNRPRAVVLRRDGGRIDGAFDDARVNVRVFADVEDDAEDLAALVIGLLLDWPNHPGPVTRVEHLSGPYGVPDESQSLVMVLVNITIHALPL